MSLPNSWVEASLDAICLLNPRLAAEERPAEEAEVTFVPMSAVDEGTGVIAKPEVRTYGAVAKGYTSFKDRDVLFAKVTPCMENGKAAIAGPLLNGLGFGSTEFHVLRPTDVVLPDYLFHFIRQPTFRKRAASAFVGTGGLQRVPQDFLARVKIPLPTLAEQQRIVDVLRMTEALRKDRSETHGAIDALTREYYTKLFGNVFVNDRSWPTARLGEISDVVRGSSPRPQGDPRLFDGPVRRLMVSDLTRDGLWVNATTDSLTVAGAKASRPMPAQSVVMAVSGAPGLTAILNHDACIHDGFVGLRDLHGHLLPGFVAFTLNLLRAKNDQQAVGAVFRNLTTDQVKAIPIPSPPVQLQEQFQVFLAQVKSVQHRVAQSKQLLQQAIAVLSVEAFSGELTTKWRDARRLEIEGMVGTRDDALRKRGATISRQATKPAPFDRPAYKTRQARQWLLGELSEFQQQVFYAFLSYAAQPLLADDPDTFAAFCADDALTEQLAGFSYSPDRIRRTLSQLAALGLIARITLPHLNPLTLERQYLKAFRPLRDDEHTHFADVEALRRALSPAGEVGE